MKSIAVFLSSLVLLGTCGNAMVTAVNTVPACYTIADQVVVTADATRVPVLANTSIYDYCSFSFNGTVTVSVQAREPIRGFSLSPKSLNLPAVANSNGFSLTLTKPCYLIVKIDGLRELVICAEAPEKTPPASAGKGVFNITTPAYHADPSGKTLCSVALQKAIDEAHSAGGGIVYVPAGVFKCANLALRSHVSLYLAEGAVLLASGTPADHITRYHKKSLGMDGTWLLYTEGNSSDIRIYGRGTIDGNARVLRREGRYLNNLVVPLQCSGFQMEGVILRDSGLWGLIPTRCDHVEIRDTKHFNENDKFYEDDAIDIIECQKVNVVHTIAISEDDTYSTKSWERGTDIAVQWPGSPEVLSDVVIDDAVAWSRCATFKVGFGVFQTQKNVTFKNGCSYRSMRALAINHNWGKEPVKNVLFENIDIEGFGARKNVPGHWLEVTTSSGSSVTASVLKNITIRDLGTSASILKGVNDAAHIDGLVFDHVLVNDKQAKSLSDLNIGATNEFVSGVVFK